MDALKKEYQKIDDVVIRKIAGQNILLFIRKKNKDKDAICTLNTTALLIIELIEKRLPIEKIIDIFTNKFDITYDTAHIDVNKIINEFIEMGCIIPVKGD